VGDAVLREFAKRLRATLRFSDEVGRYGGEEFLLVLPDCASTEALVMSERIRQAVAGTAVVASSETVSVTASFGVAGTDQGHRNATSLIAAADAALYSAKALGRNRTAVAPRHATEAATP
jgi:two-component system cell cycle response regulator